VLLSGIKLKNKTYFCSGMRKADYSKLNGKYDGFPLVVDDFYEDDVSMELFGKCLRFSYRIDGGMSVGNYLPESVENKVINLFEEMEVKREGRKWCVSGGQFFGILRPNSTIIHHDSGREHFTGLGGIVPIVGKKSGTSFFRHRETSLIHDPSEEESEALGIGEGETRLAWYESTRDKSRWEVWKTVDYRFNRMIIFPNCFWHRAEELSRVGENSDRMVHLINIGKL